MHQLIELDRVEELLRAAEGFLGGNGLVVNVGGFTRSILKFSSLSVGEVFPKSDKGISGTADCVAGFLRMDLWGPSVSDRGR